jgi:hypothetical protein
MKDAEAVHRDFAPRLAALDARMAPASDTHAVTIVCFPRRGHGPTRITTRTTVESLYASTRTPFRLFAQNS